MKRLIALSALISGCSSVPGLYAEVGAGYKIRETTSYVLRPECHVVGSTDPAQRATASCGGDNPTAHFNVGYELTKRTRCEYSHFSHYFDGGADRETHKDEIACYVRWGGK